MRSAIPNLELADAILDAIKGVTGGHAALHEPCFAGNEWAYVKDCIDTGWVSTAGQYVSRFENMIADFTGAPYVIATGTGTAALHGALIGVGVSRDDEVILPALTFVATANAVAYIGAHPHFADVEESTLGLDPKKLEQYLNQVAETENGRLINKQTRRRISAVICMHSFGHPVDLDNLTHVCKKFGLPLVEDAAESLGSYYKSKHTGNHGHVSALSFNGNKTITTGGGGAIMTHDPEMANRIRHFTTTAKQSHPWEFIHDEIGYNYRLPNLNAALGCAQMELLPAFLGRKRRLAERYHLAFADMPGISISKEPANTQSNYWLNLILLDRADVALRDQILQVTNENGVMTRPAWRPMHMLPMFQSAPAMDLSCTEDLYGRLINIPSGPALQPGADG